MLVLCMLGWRAGHTKQCRDTPGRRSWHRGLHRIAPSPLCNNTTTTKQVFVICREALADAPSCRPALDMLAAWYASLAQRARQAGDADAARTAARHGLTVLSKAALADPMRAHYWRWREQQLQDVAALLQQQPEG